MLILMEDFPTSSLIIPHASKANDKVFIVISLAVSYMIISKSGYSYHLSQKLTGMLFYSKRNNSRAKKIDKKKGITARIKRSRKELPKGRSISGAKESRHFSLEGCQVVSGGNTNEERLLQSLAV